MLPGLLPSCLPGAKLNSNGEGVLRQAENRQFHLRKLGCFSCFAWFLSCFAPEFHLSVFLTPRVHLRTVAA